MKDEQQEWLRRLTAATGMTLTQIAKRAGLADSTLTRFMNNPDVKHLLSSKTLAAIEKAVGAPFGHNERLRFVGVVQSLPKIVPYTESFAEAVPIPADDVPAWVAAAVGAIDPATALWFLQSTALEVAGYRPNDIMIVDPRIASARKDVVLVEFQPAGRLHAFFAFRIFEPPFVVTASFDPMATAPELISEDRMRIVGPVCMTLRTRRSDVLLT